ncbi:MAG TPA: pyruvate ferredoxin oxidoreductase [Gammaproteobacteria bacterium]|nr:pyruvate ferredoxin oxidoreductase [Gammaproteobacteria bacterium]
MPQALEGSQAIARAVALCRPQVISAYPITPQTHIVENLSKLVADGVLKAELVSVESEFSAASVALGAVAAGSRAYTATSSQGLLLMAEVLFNIAGLRVPLVMTCANRALSAPLSIWNDQQDSMAVRDAGWIQLYCTDNQDAVDTTIQAYRIAETTELPVMVCMDGFTLTHTLEVLELPEAAQVEAFLPPFHFDRKLDPARPLSVGTLVSPEFFTEARYTHHNALLRAIDVIEDVSREWHAITGRHSGGLLSVAGDADVDTGVLTIGAIAGTLEEAIDMRPAGERARLIRLRAFRPFPAQALREACRGLHRLVVLERALSPGAGGIVGAEVRAALGHMEAPPEMFNFSVGLGGRDVPLETFERLLAAIGQGQGRDFDLLDLQPDKLPSEAW